VNFALQDFMANLTSLYAIGVKHHCALAQHHFEHSEKLHKDDFYKIINQTK